MTGNMSFFTLKWAPTRELPVVSLAARPGEDNGGRGRALGGRAPGAAPRSGRCSLSFELSKACQQLEPTAR